MYVRLILYYEPYQKNRRKLYTTYQAICQEVFVYILGVLRTLFKYPRRGWQSQGITNTLFILPSSIYITSSWYGITNVYIFLTNLYI